MLKKERIEKLKEVFAGFDEIKAAYLFGSYADNREYRYVLEKLDFIS